MTWWRRAIAWLGDALTAMAEDDAPARACDHRYIRPHLDFPSMTATMFCAGCGAALGCSPILQSPDGLSYTAAIPATVKPDAP